VGSKNKLKRFKENEIFPNVIQPKLSDVQKDSFFLKGNWRSDFFKNNQPIVLELGCGKGEYTLHLAEQNPNRNYIGIDIKGARLWRGAKTALEKGLKNTAFLRIQIELIASCFSEAEIDEIWITFPDPQIKYKRTKHRLTRPDLLLSYKNIMIPGGSLHLKTDSEFLFGYTLATVAQIGKIKYAHHDIYNNSDAPEEATAIQTFYEQQYLDKNKAITYIKFNL
jgi:tRNA (guanine-N7-)-methyltransferase